MTQQQEAIGLTVAQQELLSHLATVPGSDIYAYGEAVDGRALEAAGLVRIVKAKSPPAATERQPYYGIKINASGRRFIARAGAA